MSDLDAAIREHLELKRLRGADPREVARLEREALGAVSRERGEAFEPDHHAQLYAIPDQSARRPAYFDGEAAAGSARFAHVDGGEETQEFSVEYQRSVAE